ncbi:unnamed protein product [Clonostachys byssicola]|uniref:Uncharacterized protein n=1 Tax=Clonostachys byssicola TaxID=160290 RepID=A0A9N9UW39_9HYPO|nr:unnamed protein product [Clonostachys byssicola]
MFFEKEHWCYIKTLAGLEIGTFYMELRRFHGQSSGDADMPFNFDICVLSGEIQYRYISIARYRISPHLTFWSVCPPEIRLGAQGTD